MSETQTPSNEDFMREFIDLKRKVQDISNSSVSGNQLATGDMVYSFASSRAGCLLCDGSVILDADQPALAAYIRANVPSLIIDGASVNLPDGRGLVLGGAGGGGFTLGTPTGVAAVTLTAAQSGSPAHTHPGGGSGTTGAGSAHNHTVGNESAHTHATAADVVHNTGSGGNLGAAGVYNQSSTNTGAGTSHTHSLTSESAHTHSFTDPTTGASSAVAAASSHTNVQPTLPANLFIKT